ncbi:GDSL-type esterase/lipase family protein [Streptomyces sp. JUS-F4]|uniref:GDSL-type esterase/lipase family protein n=1 Tax=Streptomyces TaxID=1883 RepID=UPI001C5018AE|nr:MULTISPECIES: GDSL-type esterase/lipase family protein [Streptomyces]MCX4714140.1 GDSL-type esterase/lipase family protein [Streptomyces griseus]QXR01182.1 lipase [Streptomyces sp. WY228]WKN19195.1 GDSL-type esterase/lipase family protein [Streptomyces sp. JUS-F4]
MTTRHDAPHQARQDWTTTPITLGILRGALDLEQTERGVLPHRLPARARLQIPDGQLAMAESQPSGVRLAFRTRATAVELDVVATKRVYTGAPPRPDGVYELLVDGRPAARASAADGDTLTIDMATMSTQFRTGPVETLRFTGLPDAEKGADKDVEIWLPHDETTQLVALRTDAPVHSPRPSGRPVWLHHGSSISHGSNAATPTGTWPARAAALGEAELINLGFGGSALLDPFTARALRDTPADLISVKIGINVVNADLMRLRAFGPAVHGFLDTIREGHPTAPLLVVSPICCPIHETTPGPAAPDRSAMSEGRLRFRATGDPSETAAGKLTLTVIRDELARIVRERAATDPHLHYLDGLDLYGESDNAAMPLPDDLHPDPATHRLIAERFARLAFGDGGPFRTKAG